MVEIMHDFESAGPASSFGFMQLLHRLPFFLPREVHRFPMNTITGS
jgi:hypothetical protein